MPSDRVILDRALNVRQRRDRAPRFKGAQKNSAQQAQRPAQGVARNSAQRGTRKQG